MGCLLADRGDTFGAIEYFERAVDMDPTHSRALFWLAGENALRGNDDEAIRRYEQALSRPPLHMGALINLAIIYEDNENYSSARYCLERVLDADPNCRH
jgi:DNA-directed RNA polymerase subunit alpha